MFPLTVVNSKPTLFSWRDFLAVLSRRCSHTDCADRITGVYVHILTISLYVQTVTWIGLHLHTRGQQQAHTYTQCANKHTHSLASLPLTVCLLGFAKASDPAGLIEAEGLSMHREAGRVDVSCNKTFRCQ